MIKTIFKWTFVLFILFFLAIGALWLSKETLAANYVEKTLGAPSSISAIHLSPNQLMIKGLRVYNPKGSTLKTALEIDEIQISFAFSNLLKKNKVIDEIFVKDPFVGIEMYNKSGDDNNWARMINAMGDTSEEKMKEPSEENHAMLIRHLLITNVEIEAYNPKLEKKLIRPNPISKIEFSDLYSDDPKLIRHIIKLITKAIINEVMNLNIIKKLIQTEIQHKIIDVPKKAVKKLIPFGDAEPPPPAITNESIHEEIVLETINEVIRQSLMQER